MQACIFYPFLKDYAIIKNTKYRPVFNINSKDSEMGKDRRVREINGNPLMLSEDGCVTMWTSPKWTNAELVALIATDYVCKHTGIKSIPKLENGGFGPTRLDIATFSENFNFQGLHMDIEEALQYSRKQGISEKVINPNY